MAMRAVTPTASTQNTPSFMRERRLLCFSSNEPWGTNGFELFIGLAPMASFLEVLFFSFEFSAVKFSLEKSRDVKLYCALFVLV